MRHQTLLITALLLGSLALQPAEAGPNRKKQEREEREALQASPACQAIEREYGTVFGKFEAADGALVGEHARQLVDIRRRYKDSCGELPKSMRDDLSKDVRKENKEMAREERHEARDAMKDARHEAREAARDAKHEAREAREETRGVDRDLRKELRAADRDARGMAKEGQQELRDAGRELRKEVPGIGAAAGAAAEFAKPEFRAGADDERCTKLLADMRATEARVAACGGNKACRKMEKSGFDLNQAVYSGQCGDLPRDLKKID